MMLRYFLIILFINIKEVLFTLLYMRDVWVNWFDNEEFGYNVCSFHEWRKDDFIELLDKVPVIKVDSNDFSKVENSLDDLPENLLADVRELAAVRKNNELSSLEYCFLLTDSNRSLLIDTLGEKKPIRKSRLIPRHSKMVRELVSTVDIAEYDFSCIDDKNVGFEHIGLSRKERKLRNILLDSFERLSTQEDINKLIYYYSEWDFENYKNLTDFTFKDLKNKLYRELSVGWSKKHEDFASLIIKGNIDLEEDWDNEIHHLDTKKKG